MVASPCEHNSRSVCSYPLRMKHAVVEYIWMYRSVCFGRRAAMGERADLISAALPIQRRAVDEKPCCCADLR